MKKTKALTILVIIFFVSSCKTIERITINDVMDGLNVVTDLASFIPDVGREENESGEQDVFGPVRITSPNEMAEEMVAYHNAVRAEVGAPTIRWSSEIADFALEWANYLAGNDCMIEHRPRSGPFKQQYGESLAWHSAIEVGDGYGDFSAGIREFKQLTPTKAIDGWYDEHLDYDINANECMPNRVCGHYLSMISVRTREIGCAMSVCSDKSQLWVCNYHPSRGGRGRHPLDP